MNNNFRVSFYLDGRVNKDGKKAILYRLYLATERLAMGTTGFVTSVNQWSTNKCRMIPSAKDARYVNSALDTIEGDLRAIFRRLEFSESLSLDKIRATYLLKDENPSMTFFEYFDAYIERRKQEVGNGLSISSIQKFTATRTRFAEFLESKYKRRDIQFNELDFHMITDFEHYLKTVAQNQHNTVMRRLKTFKGVVTAASRDGYIFRDPFNGVRIHFDPVDRGFLTEKEVEAIMTYDFKIQRLEHVRDLFIFACFTGLAYIDVAQLTYDKIVELDGKLWIISRRQKTNVSSNIPLLTIPLQLIEKYRGQTKDNRVFPMISNQKQNQYLKEIADCCGIDKNLTYHLARHTFATLSLSKGVPIESVSKMLGHNNIRTTQIYARITNNKIGDDMDMLAAKLEGLNGKLANMPDSDTTQGETAEKQKDATTTETKRRGRPKKLITKAVFANAHKVKTTQVGPTEATPAPAKKRGRPKKSQAAASQTSCR